MNNDVWIKPYKSPNTYSSPNRCWKRKCYKQCSPKYSRYWWPIFRIFAFKSKIKWSILSLHPIIICIISAIHKTIFTCFKCKLDTFVLTLKITVHLEFNPKIKVEFRTKSNLCLSILCLAFSSKRVVFGFFDYIINITNH